MSDQQEHEVRLHDLMLCPPRTRAAHYQREAARFRELALTAMLAEVRSGFFEVAVQYDELALTVSRRS